MLKEKLNQIQFFTDKKVENQQTAIPVQSNEKNQTAQKQQSIVQDEYSIRVQDKPPSGAIASPLVLHNKKFLGIPISRGDVDSIPLVITPEGKLGLPIDRKTAAFMKGRGENSFIGMMKKMKEFFTGGGNTQSMGGGSYNAETGEYTGVSQYESSVSSPSSDSFSYAEYKENQHNQQTAERIASRPETVAPLASSHSSASSTSASSVTPLTQSISSYGAFDPDSVQIKNDVKGKHSKRARLFADNKRIYNAIIRAAVENNINPAFLLSKASQESGFKEKAPSGTGAAGLFQFTWGAKEETEKRFPEFRGKGDWRLNAELAAKAAGLMSAEYLKDFKRTAIKLGVRVTDDMMNDPRVAYATWFLGPGGAAQAFKYAQDRPNEMLTDLAREGNMGDLKHPTNQRVIAGYKASQIREALGALLDKAEVTLSSTSGHQFNYRQGIRASQSLSTLSPLPGTVVKPVPQQSTATVAPSAIPASSAPHKNVKLVWLAAKPGGYEKLHSLTKERLNTFAANLEQYGIPARLDTGYRDHAMQTMIKNTGVQAAKAGRSYHQTGLAFDLHHDVMKKHFYANKALSQQYGGNYDKFIDEQLKKAKLHRPLKRTGDFPHVQLVEDEEYHNRVNVAKLKAERGNWRDGGSRYEKNTPKQQPTATSATIPPSTIAQPIQSPIPPPIAQSPQQTAQAINVPSLSSNKQAIALNGVPSDAELKKYLRFTGKNVDISGLTPIAKKRLYHLAKRWKKDTGTELPVNDGYRTKEKQTHLYNLWRTGKGNPAYAPGRSNHQSGLAADIQLYNHPFFKGNMAAYDKYIQQSGLYRKYKSDGERHHVEVFPDEEAKALIDFELLAQDKRNNRIGMRKGEAMAYVRNKPLPLQQSQNIEDRRSTTPEVQTTPQVANVQPLLQQQTGRSVIRSGGSNGIPNKMAKKIGDMAIERSKTRRSVGSCAAGVKHIVAMAHGFMRYEQRDKILQAGSANDFLTNGSLEKAGFRVISENTAKGYKPLPGDIIVYKKAKSANPKDPGVTHGHIQVYGSDGNWYSDHNDKKNYGNDGAGYKTARYGYKGSIYKIYRLPPEKEPDATVQEEQPQSQAEVIPSNEQVSSSIPVQNQQTAQQYNEPIGPELAPQAGQTVSPIITPTQSETVAENVTNAAVVASNIPSGNLKMDTAIIHAQNVVINGNVENTNKENETNEEQTQETLETVPQQDNVQIPFVQTQEQASAELVKSEPLLQTQQTVKKEQPTVEQPTVTHSELFGNSLEKLGVTGVSSLLPTNNPLGNFGFGGIGSSIGNIGNIINGIISSVQNAISIPQQIAGNVQGIIGQVKNVPQNIMGQVNSISQPIANLIKNPKEFLRNPASAIGSISGSVQNAIGTVSSIIKNPMESLGLGNIGSSIGSIANQIGGLFNPQNYDINKMLAVGGGFGGAIGAGTPFFGGGGNAGNIQSNIPMPNLDVFQNNNQKINEIRTDTLMQNDVEKQQAASQPAQPIMIGGGGGYPNGGNTGGNGGSNGQSPSYGTYTGINNIGPSGMLGINEDLYVQFLRLRQAASGFGIL